ncbi:MAG: UPF0301 protein AlgH [Porticoccaceae bacterium]|nr:MAG: UPF0301 protein AlgH [Porticoccaceae bacterium]
MSAPKFHSLKDHFLVAMPGLRDPNFRDTVVYLFEHGPEGAIGLIINRPTEVPMARVFAELKLQCPEEVGRRPVLLGGPVQPERGFVIHRPATRRFESTLQVSDEICITASQDILAAIAGREGPEASYITLGYAGWGPGQLEAEIAANSWLVVRADPSIVFDVPFEQRLAATTAKIGVDLGKLSPVAGHA